MRFIRSIVLWVIAFGLAEYCVAQVPTENSILWEVSGNGIKTSYLYGTIHVICPDDVKIDSNTTLSLRKSEQLYLELDMDDPALNEKMQKKMLNKRHLRSLMDKKNYEKLATFFENRVGYSIDMLGMIKPFYLLSFTYSPMIGCSQPTSVENQFIKMATEQNKEILGLETLEEQTKIFDNIPQKQQANLLYDYVQNFDKMQESLLIMLNQYRNQDLVGLMQSASESHIKNEKFEESLLAKRNEKWVKEIPQIIEKKSTFFAFGAAHLGGENGVINLLRKAGYRVKAVL
ncbi:MAG: TraB/GumN family protein [Spirosomataceae bacterium]